MDHTIPGTNITYKEAEGLINEAEEQINALATGEATRVKEGEGLCQVAARLSRQLNRPVAPQDVYVKHTANDSAKQDRAHQRGIIHPGDLAIVRNPSMAKGITEFRKILGRNNPDFVLEEMRLEDDLRKFLDRSLPRLFGDNPNLLRGEEGTLEKITEAFLRSRQRQ